MSDVDAKIGKIAAAAVAVVARSLFLANAEL